MVTFSYLHKYDVYIIYNNITSIYENWSSETDNKNQPPFSKLFILASSHHWDLFLRNIFDFIFNRNCNFISSFEAVIFTLWISGVESRYNILIAFISPSLNISRCPVSVKIFVIRWNQLYERKLIYKPISKSLFTSDFNFMHEPKG